MEITRAVHSGRQWASALAKCAPREWPTRATRRPIAAWMPRSRSSSRWSARSEQSTFILIPEANGR
jgi:hypothetical protein